MTINSDISINNAPKIYRKALDISVPFIIINISHAKNKHIIIKEIAIKNNIFFIFNSNPIFV